MQRVLDAQMDWGSTWGMKFNAKNSTIWYTQFSYCSLHGYINKKHMNTVKIIIIKFDNINISITVIIVIKYLSVLPNIIKCCIIQMNG